MLYKVMSVMKVVCLSWFVGLSVLSKIPQSVVDEF